jgi:hypothetical protein
MPGTVVSVLKPTATRFGSQPAGEGSVETPVLAVGSPAPVPVATALPDGASVPVRFVGIALEVAEHAARSRTTMVVAAP